MSLGQVTASTFFDCGTAVTMATETIWTTTWTTNLLAANPESTWDACYTVTETITGNPSDYTRDALPPFFAETKVACGVCDGGEIVITAPVADMTPTVHIEGNGVIAGVLPIPVAAAPAHATTGPEYPAEGESAPAAAPAAPVYGEVPPGAAPPAPEGEVPPGAAPPAPEGEVPPGAAPPFPEGEIPAGAPPAPEGEVPADAPPAPEGEVPAEAPPAPEGEVPAGAPPAPEGEVPAGDAPPAPEGEEEGGNIAVGQGTPEEESDVAVTGAPDDSADVGAPAPPAESEVVDDTFVQASAPAVKSSSALVAISALVGVMLWM